MKDSKMSLELLKVSGGMAANDLFLQIQADLLGLAVCTSLSFIHLFIGIHTGSLKYTWTCSTWTHAGDHSTGCCNWSRAGDQYVFSRVS